MNSISHVIRVSLPEYLKNLPVPDSFGGIFRLGVTDWLSLTPLAAFFAGTAYLSYQALCPEAHKKRAAKDKPKVNLNIKKDDPKVVDTVDIEDLGDKKVFCRCWRSKKFPYCDGAHNAHNEETGDNVGPLIIKK